MGSPTPDDDLGLSHRIEDLAIEQFVPELAVEALIVAILPRRSRLYVKRLHPDPAEPVPHRGRCKLRPIIRSEVRRRTVPREQIGVST